MTWWVVCWAVAGQLWTCSPPISQAEAIRSFQYFDTPAAVGHRLALMFDARTKDDAEREALARMKLRAS